jgi:hypothetical protein
MRVVCASAQHGERLALHSRAVSTARGRRRYVVHRLNGLDPPFIFNPEMSDMN